MSQAEPHIKERKVPGREDLRQRIETRIERLERASANGLWSMALFLLVSFLAFEDFSMFPSLSDETRRMLGAPPPSGMISLALVVYAFLRYHSHPCQYEPEHQAL